MRLRTAPPLRSAAFLAFVAEVRLGPYDVALGREINADLCASRIRSRSRSCRMGSS